MARPLELGVYTDNNGENLCLKVFDLGSGVELRSFKDGNAGRHCVSLDHPNYVVCGLNGKQLIHFWDKYKEQVAKKIVCPGKISSLAVSPDGHYCVVGLEEKLYIWQISTGDLLAVLSKHYQAVTCLKFIDTGSHFLSGGDDGLVVVWDLASSLVQWASAGHANNQSPVLHVWSHHSLPVTDVFTGVGGLSCRVATASIDHTCKLYDLASGILLCSFVFDGGVTALTLDSAELQLFAGLVTGSIENFTLYKPSIQREVYVNAEEHEKQTSFTGHTKQVTSLSVSLDGCTLLSGSMDCSCRVWHIESKQCLKVINCKGAVSNVLIISAPYQLWQSPSSSKLLPPIGNFKRTLYSANPPGSGSSLQDGGSSQSNVNVILKDLKPETVFSCRQNEVTAPGSDEDEELFAAVVREFSGSEAYKPESKISYSRADLEERLETLEQCNRNLREFISTRLLQRLAEGENQEAQER